MGNKIVLDSDGSYKMGKNTGERMQPRMQDGTFVFDMQYGRSQIDSITLEPGAGMNVLPSNLLPDVPTNPKRAGLWRCATDGIEIPNLSRKIAKLTSTDYSRRV